MVDTLAHKRYLLINGSLSEENTVFDSIYYNDGYVVGKDIDTGRNCIAICLCGADTLREIKNLHPEEFI